LTNKASDKAGILAQSISHCAIDSVVFQYIPLDGSGASSPSNTFQGDFSVMTHSALGKVDEVEVGCEPKHLDAKRKGSCGATPCDLDLVGLSFHL